MTTGEQNMGRFILPNTISTEARGTIANNISACQIGLVVDDDTIFHEPVVVPLDKDLLEAVQMIKNIVNGAMNRTAPLPLVPESKLEALEANIKSLVIEATSQDLIPSENRTKLLEQIRDLKRAELETLIANKIIHAIRLQSEVSVLRKKLTKSNVQRRKLFRRAVSLDNQVTKLLKLKAEFESKLENTGRTQYAASKGNKGAQPTVRYYRTVAIQVPEQPERLIQKAQSFPAKNTLKQNSRKHNAWLMQPTRNGSYGNTRPFNPVATSPTQLHPVFGARGTNIHPYFKRPFSIPDIATEGWRAYNAMSAGENKIRKLTTPLGASVTPSGGRLYERSSTSAAPPAHNEPDVFQKMPTYKMYTSGGVFSKPLGNSGCVTEGVVDLSVENHPPLNNSIEKAGAGNLFGTGNTRFAPKFQQPGLLQPVNLGTNDTRDDQTGRNYQKVLSSSMMTLPMFVPSFHPLRWSGQQLRSLASYSSWLPTQREVGRIVGLKTAPTIQNHGQLFTRPAGPLLPTNAVFPMVAERPANEFEDSTGSASDTATIIDVNEDASSVDNGVDKLARAQSYDPTPTVCQVSVTNSRSQSVAKEFVLPPMPPPGYIEICRRSPKDFPPKPILTVDEQGKGVALSWTLKLGPNHAGMRAYEVYLCEEPLLNVNKDATWMRVGVVKALPLPMACDLSELFTEENRYHFAVRGVDNCNRTGPFSEVSATKLKLTVDKPS